MMSGFPPIFVMSLPRSRERQAHITRVLTELNLRWEFVDAVDGSALTLEALRTAAGAAALEVRTGLGRPLTAEEIGCALSHQLCYRLLLERGLPMAFVFEDDVDVPPQFVEVAKAIPRFPPNWELVLFAHHSARNGTSRGAETTWQGAAVHPRHRVARVAEFAMGAMAYLLTSEGARKLLRHGTPVRMPADWLTGYAPSAGVRLYAITPPVVTPHAADPFATTIPGRDSDSGGVLAAGDPGPAAQLRLWAGTVWLWLRKAGVCASAYSRRI